MRILVLGDFHGKFPSKLKSIVKKDKIDVVVSVGDYPPFSMEKEFFKYVFAKENVNLWDKEILGKKKYKELRLKDLESAKEVLRKLDKLPVKVVSAIGNHDYPLADDVVDIKKPKDYWKWDWDRLDKLRSFMSTLKNVKKIDYSYFKFKGYVFVGARGHSFPGRVKSKAYKKSRQKLEKIFKKFSKENKEGKLIFVTHVPLYKTKLDIIKAKEANKLVKNEHYGGKLFKRIVNKYQPILHLCGHIEESKGKENVGKTLSINSGSVQRKDYVVINIDDKKGEIKSVKFHKF